MNERAFIPFNRASAGELELQYMGEAISGGHLTADGPFTKRATELLEALTGAPALLVQSCTAALEIALRLCALEPGDEVIVPSFTFASTANAIVLGGGVPVFVDVDPETLCMDVDATRAAVSSRTRAIVPVHYAGVSCDMDRLQQIAVDSNTRLIEDAAQGLRAYHDGRHLGSIGDLGTLSFHETKNITCGEGGALLINDPRLRDRAEIIREKGTDRSRFVRGQVDKYTWVDIGSSYALSDLNAAFLCAQLERSEELTARRRAIWARYHDAFADLEERGLARRPRVPDGCVHNAHLYYLLVDMPGGRDAVIESLAARGVNAVFHYVPLHDAPAGLVHGRAHGDLAVTDAASRSLLRLPMWADMTTDDVEHVVEATVEAVSNLRAGTRAR